MCKFFSCISNGKGKVLFFTLEDIQKIEKEGNPEKYESWNSHTSIAHYNKIKGADEDKWNKWEYDCETKKLKIDGDFNTSDDSKKILPKIEKYIADNNAIYLQKIYNRNSGDRNSGDRNSGNMNSGDWNSGNRNSGDRNSGYWNSGDWNSGDRNSGYCNSNQPLIRIFNKETEKKLEEINFPQYFYFEINQWIPVDDMTEKEKEEYWWYKTTEGYLRKIEYKEAWQESFKQASKEDVALTLKLPNFDYKIFEEISGITKKMIDKRLSQKT